MQGAVETFPVARRHGAVAVRAVGAIRAVGDQDLGAAADVGHLEAGEHEPAAAEAVHFRRPKLPVGPKARRGAEGRERAVPVFQVAAAVAVKALAAVPRVLVGAAEEVIDAFLGHGDDERVADSDVGVGEHEGGYRDA